MSKTKNKPPAYHFQKGFLLFLLFSSIPWNMNAQPIAETFELRYFTSDTAANGETDFKGATEWFDTEERIAFLKAYADYASRYFNDPDLNQQVVSDKEINHLLSNIKPQPTTKIRKSIPLNEWKTYGYKEGQDLRKKEALAEWEEFPGVKVSEGELELNNTTIKKRITPLTWRFKLQFNVTLTQNSRLTLTLGEKEKPAMLLRFRDENNTTNDNHAFQAIPVKHSNGSLITIEGDLSQKRFNCYVDDALIHDFSLLADTSVAAISSLSFSVTGLGRIDDLFLFNHIPQEKANYPYFSQVLTDENFEPKPGITGWQSFGFNDHHWKKADLPAVHGGIRQKEEPFYLRKSLVVDDFQRAFLQLETLDPGGEVWVNGQVVAVITNRHPHEIEVTSYLKKKQENLLAIKVNPYRLNRPMPHTPTDHHIGWFLGRTKLLLTSKCVIKEIAVSTRELKEDASQIHKVTIHNPGHDFFEGSIEINYYPWFPEEGPRVATFSREINVRPRIDHEMQFEFPVPSPQAWSPESPHLYKVETILKDKEGNPVDDYVVTTGIRTLHQGNGHLYLNGQQAMLNGAQIMGFRTPVETIAKHNRCAPLETVAEELLMIKKMNANMLRIHVHAEKDTTDGINDPRYAEFADQMGICLIWSTAAFMREGEAWNIDFAGYPKFMKQVINHPSIVMWEASNHPNRFKKHGIEETHDFVKKVYNTIYQTDRSRLISPTSFWQHTHYGNYEGTVDYQGQAITAVPEYMAERNTRGSQDAYTGYGAEWTKLRNAPNPWAASCLAANDKAYFNFEHEESIGQPNWELSKGKPWHLIHSYEWSYDKGSIGRLLTTEEWRESQAWQAFSAWESMKKQMLLGYDGFSWCTIRGGANMGTYQKPLIDNLRHPKLAWYINKMVFQKTWGASKNVDVVYGPDDKIIPVIHHLGNEKRVDLIVKLKTLNGKIITEKQFKNISLQNGRQVVQLQAFRFIPPAEGAYVIHYLLQQ